MTTTLNIGDHVELDITDIAFGGDGIFVVRQKQNHKQGEDIVI